MTSPRWSASSELTFDVVDDGLVGRSAALQPVEAADVLVEANRLASTGGAGNEDMAARDLFRQKHGTELQRLGPLLLGFLVLDGRLQPMLHLVQVGPCWHLE